jgi:hypothetical protein
VIDARPQQLSSDVLVQSVDPGNRELRENDSLEAMAGRRSIVLGRQAHWDGKSPRRRVKIYH